MPPAAAPRGPADASGQVAPAAAPADAPKGDILLNGYGYESGNHLATATGAAGYAWREIAVIRPGAVDDSSWTGSGLRQALGAHPQPITPQFLTESTALGALGGLIGAALAATTVVGMAPARGWTAVLHPYAVLPAP